MTNMPNAEAVLAALEATWPPADVIDQPPFRLRRGLGGGKRVSAATTSLDGTQPDVGAAEQAMRDMGQTPLFRLVPGQDAFDEQLEDRGFKVADPTLLMAKPTEARQARPVKAGLTDRVRTLWSAGGIDPARFDVMGRVDEPNDMLSLAQGAVFVALGGGGAMFHALIVDPKHRRQGAGRDLVVACEAWAHAYGAPWLSLAVVEANLGAIALYSSLGFQPVGRYWYRTRG